MLLLSLLRLLLRLLFFVFCRRFSCYDVVFVDVTM